MENFISVREEQKLIEWFKKNHKKLPWRPENLLKKRDAYQVWISEIMLQQTQVEAVKKYYTSWIRKFPDIKTLVLFNEETVLKFWQGLGYYSRARNILKTAKILHETYNAQFPENRKILEQLPGIGKYTAGAILSFAFHKNESILDGNLIRVFSRLFKLSFLPEKEEEKNIFWNYSGMFARGKFSFLKNEALMELGRCICKVKNPICTECPFQKVCKAFNENLIEELPPKKKRNYLFFKGIILVIKSKDNYFYVEKKNDSLFFKNQICFPHFECNRFSKNEIPLKAETFLENFNVKSFTYKKEYSHAITKYKMQITPLYIEIKENHGNKKNWIAESLIEETLHNAFSLKACKTIFE